MFPLSFRRIFSGVGVGAIVLGIAGLLASQIGCVPVEGDVKIASTEICNGIDDDLDGEVDENGAFGASTWYKDDDRDSYGNDSKTLISCDQPASGYILIGGDCDDANSSYNPGADEVCGSDPNDYNCDGQVGYTDNDGDSFAACEDCNDANDAINPVAEEVCDNADNNCDGVIDTDAVDADTWYSDRDSDGYGDGDADTIESCDQPAGYTDNSDDCDDTDSSVSTDCDGGDEGGEGGDGTGEVEADYPVAIPMCTDTVKYEITTLTEGDSYVAVAEIENSGASGTETWTMYVDSKAEGVGIGAGSTENLEVAFTADNKNQVSICGEDSSDGQLLSLVIEEG